MSDPRATAAVPCAGALVFDPAGRLLLVQRRYPPAPGRWCEPSGKCEPGESAVDACVREAYEETGLHVRVVRPVGSVCVTGPDGTIFEIADFECEQVSGELRAGDDAADVRWVGRSELDALPLVPDLAETLAAWGCLPRA